MPLYNWEKCQEGQIHYVNKDLRPRQTDLEQWLKLYNEYLERYGVAAQTEEYLKRKVHLTKLRYQYILSNDVFLLNNIKVAEIELKTLDPSKHEGMDTTEILIHLSKWLGYRVDTKLISVVEFKKMIEEYVRSNKEK